MTPIFIEQWRTKRLKAGRTIETVNRDVATFKAAISKAVEWKFIETRPLAELKPLKTDNSVKLRYLNDDEEIRLRKALEKREEEIRTARDQANNWRSTRGYDLLPNLRTKYFADYIKPMVLISINTGVRQGELFGLQWENIDFSSKTLTIEGKLAKSGKTRHIPLNEEAYDVLYKWHKTTVNRNGLVFQNKEGEKFNNVKKAWANLLKAAEINNFRWHDMRHHFASRLVMAGVDLNTVRELLGHSDIKMTLRYAHLAPKHKAEAVAKLVRSNLESRLDSISQ
jgi:integrase